jgi:hypothetical protein
MLGLINAQNKAGNTALHWAALNGHLSSVKTLLELEADPTITNQKGHDAVYEAELNDKEDVVRWVLKESESLEQGLGEAANGGEEDTADSDEKVDVDEEAKPDGDDAFMKDEVLELEEDVHKMKIKPCQQKMASESGKLADDAIPG